MLEPMPSDWLLKAAEDEDLELARLTEDKKWEGNLMELVREYEQKLEALAGAEALVKNLKARVTDLAVNQIPAKMQELGIATVTGKGSLTTASGARLSLRTDLHVSTNVGDRDQVHAWLRSSGAGDLVTETVNAAALKAHVRELEADNRPIPEFIKVYRETKVQLTRPRS